MSIKKYSSGQWVDTPYRKYGTETDTIATLPKTIIGDGQSASAVIKGNMQQTGTPTPTNPIYPTECGDLETTGEHAGQYKIPILNNSQTTNVYLGEVQSTRRIKKYEFTGTEALQTSGSGNARFFYLSIADARSWAAIIGDRYVNANISSTSEDIGIAMSGNSQFRIRPDLTSTVNDFKTYLQQQYAAGTPVTVWYVLATPTTGIVNEPLRKIGDYADSVTGTNIPTIGTAETFDVDTTLKPSEVSLTYHGWHEHIDTVFSNP